MKPNNKDLIRVGDTIYRVIGTENDSLLVVDCLKKYMPQWIDTPQSYTPCTEAELLSETGVSIPKEEELSPTNRKLIHQKYTLIAPILTVIEDDVYRAKLLNLISEKHKISRVTLRKYLTLYLIYQNICIFASKPTARAHQPLSDEAKLFRWGINRFYLTSRKNSLRTAYEMLLKEKFCDVNGQLIEGYPPYHRFYYYYRTHRNIRNELITRDGLSNYQRNHRPILGGGVREFCPTVGYGMVDSTVCDIYLVNESGKLIGRPILTICVDAFSSMIMGYSLGWEGGISSVSAMFQNVLSDKMEHCKKYGIDIQPDDWNCTSLPAVIISDRGREYVGSTLEQLTELGVSITNLEGYRGDLKGVVEQCFNVLQNLYKPHLKGKGVIMPDFQERGTKDYRRDACFTLFDFKRVILRCILYYNTQRIIENFPYSDDEEIKPYANAIFNHYKEQGNLITVDSDTLYKTLLPRTDAKFTRKGLRVGKLHYRCLGFVEECLQEAKAIVAYDPKDVSYVFLIKDGNYIRFSLIESAFKDKSLQEAEDIIRGRSEVVKREAPNALQAKITLANDISTIAHNCLPSANISTKGIRATRQKERRKKR